MDEEPKTLEDALVVIANQRAQMAALVARIAKLQDKRNAGHRKAKLAAAHGIQKQIDALRGDSEMKDDRRDAVMLGLSRAHKHVNEMPNQSDED